MKKLSISNNKKYIMQDNKPFFWLGDTAWLLFHKLSEEDAYIYLKNRAEKGYNVIQAVLIYSLPGMKDINKMYVPYSDAESKEYWEHCDRIIKMAEELGLYMGLLPSWGSLVKNKIITKENIKKYAEFLCSRYKDYSNIIWILGGDIRADGFEDIYNILGFELKNSNPDRLITFHPFGRCASSIWFNNCEWLDFNMFQSGHRRYDQYSLGKWDDNNKKENFFGEDNWKYVLEDMKKNPLKPTLDGEPSYEWILQGLHDNSQPYWTAKHIRRYAYWSVFAGACGHTHGDNSIMQFYNKNNPKDYGSYGVKSDWREALHHEGSGQMKYLADLMNSVNFTSGSAKNDIIIGGQREKHERIAVFAGDEYIFAYSWLGNDFEIDIGKFGEMEIYWFSPSTGIYSYAGTTDKNFFKAVPAKNNAAKDVVLVLKSVKKKY